MFVLNITGGSNLERENFKKIMERLETVNENLETVNENQETMNKVIPTLLDAAIANNNLWTPSKISGGRDPDFRTKMMNDLGYNKKKTPLCMVTGIRGKGDKVVAGHIIPCSSEARKIAELGISLSDLNDVKNGVFWVKAIENAWEHLQLSFIKSNPFQDKLYMKIWDDNIRNTPLYVGSTRHVGEFDNAELKLNGHIVMKRGFSYQAYQSYMSNAGSDEILKKACLYGSPGTYKYMTEMEIMKGQVVKDIEEEVEEEESEGDDDDDI